MPTATATATTTSQRSSDAPARPAPFELTPVTPSIGAEVTAIDLGSVLDDDTVASLRRALVRHKVLVFRDQPISPDAHVALARRFGELEVHPVFPHHPDHPELVLLGGTAASKASENIYHSDVSWRATPVDGLVAALRGVPAVGWRHDLGQHGAGLREPARVVAGATRLARGRPRPAARVRAAPDAASSGPRPVSPSRRWSTRWCGPTPRAASGSSTSTRPSRPTSPTTPRRSSRGSGPTSRWRRWTSWRYLLRQATIPEYQMRLHWEPDTLVIWDNRSTQHYAVQDYFPAVRRMMRATVVGDRPR